MTEVVTETKPGTEAMERAAAQAVLASGELVDQVGEPVDGQRSPVPGAAGQRGDYPLCPRLARRPGRTLPARLRGCAVEPRALVAECEAVGGPEPAARVLIRSGGEDLSYVLGALAADVPPAPVTPATC